MGKIVVHPLTRKSLNMPLHLSASERSDSVGPIAPSPIHRARTKEAGDLLFFFATQPYYQKFLQSGNEIWFWTDPQRRILHRLIIPFLLLFTLPAFSQEVILTCFSNGAHYTLDGNSLNSYVPNSDISKQGQEFSYDIWPAGQIVSAPGGYPRWGKSHKPKSDNTPLLYTWELTPIYEVTYTTMYIGFHNETPVTCFLTFTLNNRLESRLIKVFVFEEHELQPWE